MSIEQQPPKSIQRPEKVPVSFETQKAFGLRRYRRMEQKYQQRHGEVPSPQAQQ